MKVTPLHLEILVHYLHSHDQFERLAAPACRDYAHELDVAGILDKDNAGNYTITDKGKAWAEYMMRVSLPIQHWVLPESILDSNH